MGERHFKMRLDGRAEAKRFSLPVKVYGMTGRHHCFNYGVIPKTEGCQVPLSFVTVL